MTLELAADTTSGISTNGSIQFVTITGGGSGYTTNPNFTFVGIDTTLPTGVTTGFGYGVINNDGVVTAGYIRYGGENYNLTGLSTITSVVVDTPVGLGSTVGVGTFIYNEVVFGGTSGTEQQESTLGIVRQLNLPSRLLMVHSHLENLSLVESLDIHMMRSQIVDDLVTPFTDNDNIETEQQIGYLTLLRVIHLEILKIFSC